MKVRRLTPPDTVQYRSMMLRAYELHPDAFTSSVAERSAKPVSWWEARLDPAVNAQELVFGALVDDVLQGVAGISFETREKARHKASIFGMYVDRQVRSAGTGLKLLAELVSQARTRDGVRILQLTVTQGNEPAESLYRKAGFRPFGVEPLAVQVGNTFVSKVHMWRDLLDADEGSNGGRT